MSRLNIARDSVFYAAAVVEKMLATAIGLNQFPDAGRVVPELDQANIRERFVYSYRLIYRLIYRVEPERILAAAVVHGRRSLDDSTVGGLSGQ